MVDTVDPVPGIDELTEAVWSEVGDEDAFAELRTAFTVAGRMTRTADDLVRRFVQRARVGGHSWAEISSALGVTRQAAHKRYSKPGLLDDLPTTLSRRALRAIEVAYRIAADSGLEQIQTEHVLIGLVWDPVSLASSVLRTAGIDPGELTATKSKRGRRHLRAAKRVRLSQAVHSVLTTAESEAESMGHSYVGTEHILLALCHPELPGPVQNRLVIFGFDVTQARVAVLKELRDVQANMQSSLEDREGYQLRHANLRQGPLK